MRVAALGHLTASDGVYRTRGGLRCRLVGTRKSFAPSLVGTVHPWWELCPVHRVGCDERVSGAFPDPAPSSTVRQPRASIWRLRSQLNPHSTERAGFWIGCAGGCRVRHRPTLSLRPQSRAEALHRSQFHSPTRPWWTFHRMHPDVSSVGRQDYIVSSDGGSPRKVLAEDQHLDGFLPGRPMGTEWRGLRRPRTENSSS